MNLPEQLDLNTWLVDLELNPPHSRCLLSQLFQAGSAHSFVLFYAKEGAQNSRLLEVLEVVYETSFWAINPKELCLSIINDYHQCSDRRAPVELVYTYGGTINGRVPLLSSPPATH